LLLEELIDLLGINRFSGLEPLNEFLDPESLELPLCPGDTLRRLGLPL
jgi:hypothetical protein